MPNLATSIAGLQSFDDEEIAAILAAGMQRTLDDGEIVVAKGEPRDEMYILISGAVRIDREPREPVLLRRAYDYFGEMSLVYPGHRPTATVTALGPTVTAALGQQSVAALTRSHPKTLIKLLTRICAGLVDANARLLASLSDKNRELDHSHEHLRRARAALGAQEALARIDPLTELYNRRFLIDQLAVAIDDPGPAPERTALAMIDLDRFKEINDRFGHTRGDAVLKRVAHAIREQVRSTDLPCRYGGDELAILLRNIGNTQLTTRLDKLRESIEALAPCHPDAPRVTASVGAAFCRPGDTLTSLIDRADACLYEAKRQGRNRCVVVS